VREKLGLDRPVVTRYVEWLAHVLRVDFGRSLINDRPVAADLVVRLGRTLQLIVPAISIAVILGVPAGVFAARRRGTIYDPVTSAVTLLGFSVPVFVVGPMLVYVFALWLKVPWAVRTASRRRYDLVPCWRLRGSRPPMRMARGVNRRSTTCAPRG
jgi:peptide/nickel transport system permease protein